MPHPPEGIEQGGCRFQLSISHYTYEKAKVNHRQTETGTGQTHRPTGQPATHSTEGPHLTNTLPPVSLAHHGRGRCPPPSKGGWASVKSPSGTQESRPPEGTQLWTHNATAQESSPHLAPEGGVRAQNSLSGTPTETSVCTIITASCLTPPTECPGSSAPPSLPHSILGRPGRSRWGIQ